MKKSYTVLIDSVDIEAKIITAHWSKIEYQIITDALRSRKQCLEKGTDVSRINNCLGRLQNILSYIDSTDTSDFELNEVEFTKKQRRLESEIQAFIPIDIEDLKVKVKYSLMDHLIILESLRYYKSMSWMECEAAINPEYTDYVLYLVKEYRYIDVDGWLINSDRITGLLRKNETKYMNISLIACSGSDNSEGIGYTIVELSDSLIDIW